VAAAETVCAEPGVVVAADVGVAEAAIIPLAMKARAAAPCVTEREALRAAAALGAAAAATITPDSAAASTTALATTHCTA